MHATPYRSNRDGQRLETLTELMYGRDRSMRLELSGELLQPVQSPNRADLVFEEFGAVVRGVERPVQVIASKASFSQTAGPYGRTGDIVR